MYLDCLIIGKTPNIDLRTPRINFMDQAKLLELAAADLVTKGDDDPANWVFGRLPVSVSMHYSFLELLVLSCIFFCSHVPSFVF